MRVSIGVTNFSWPSGPGGLSGELVRLVRAVDQAGVDTVWVADHLLQADPTAGPDDTEMLEAYTTLGFLAAQTERVRLGTMVSPVALWPPALLVKAVSTLDVLSGGRAWLGIGAGYHGEEAQALDLPLPPVAERFERLEETLQIAIRMWAGNETSEGKHYRLQHPIEKTLGTRLEAGESSDDFVRRAVAAAELGIEHPGRDHRRRVAAASVGHARRGHPAAARGPPTPNATHGTVRKDCACPPQPHRTPIAGR